MAINEVQITDPTKDPYSQERFVIPATEETAKQIAGANYDTTVVNVSNPNNIVIQYLKDSVLVMTETIVISGEVITINKS